MPSIQAKMISGLFKLIGVNKMLDKQEADERHYDIVFSVMQGQQQLALLPILSSLNTDLLVLVGNNMETDKCEEVLKNMPHACQKTFTATKI